MRKRTDAYFKNIIELFKDSLGLKELKIDSQDPESSMILDHKKLLLEFYLKYQDEFKAYLVERGKSSGQPASDYETVGVDHLIDECKQEIKSLADAVGKNEKIKVVFYNKDKGFAQYFKSVESSDKEASIEIENFRVCLLALSKGKTLGHWGDPFEKNSPHSHGLFGASGLSQQHEVDFRKLLALAYLTIKTLSNNQKLADLSEIKSTLNVKWQKKGEIKTEKLTPSAVYNLLYIEKCTILSVESSDAPRRTCEEFVENYINKFERGCIIQFCSTVNDIWTSHNQDYKLPKTGSQINSPACGPGTFGTLISLIYQMVSNQKQSKIVATPLTIKEIQDFLIDSVKSDQKILTLIHECIQESLEEFELSESKIMTHIPKIEGFIREKTAPDLLKNILRKLQMQLSRSQTARAINLIFNVLKAEINSVIYWGDKRPHDPEGEFFSKISSTSSTAMQELVQLNIIWGRSSVLRAIKDFRMEIKCLHESAFEKFKIAEKAANHLQLALLGHHDDYDVKPIIDWHAYTGRLRQDFLNLKMLFEKTLQQEASEILLDMPKMGKDIIKGLSDLPEEKMEFNSLHLKLITAGEKGARTVNRLEELAIKLAFKFSAFIPEEAKTQEPLFKQLSVLNTFYPDKEGEDGYTSNEYEIKLAWTKFRETLALVGDKDAVIKISADNVFHELSEQILVMAASLSLEEQIKVKRGIKAWHQSLIHFFAPIKSSSSLAVEENIYGYQLLKDLFFFINLIPMDPFFASKNLSFSAYQEKAKKLIIAHLKLKGEVQRIGIFFLNADNISRQNSFSPQFLNIISQLTDVKLKIWAKCFILLHLLQHQPDSIFFLSARVDKKHCEFSLLLIKTLLTSSQNLLITRIKSYDEKLDAPKEVKNFNDLHERIFKKGLHDQKLELIQPNFIGAENYLALSSIRTINHLQTISSHVVSYPLADLTPTIKLLKKIFTEVEASFAEERSQIRQALDACGMIAIKMFSTILFSYDTILLDFIHNPANIVWRQLLFLSNLTRFCDPEVDCKEIINKFSFSSEKIRVGAFYLNCKSSSPRFDGDFWSAVASAAIHYPERRLVKLLVFLHLLDLNLSNKAFSFTCWKQEKPEKIVSKFSSLKIGPIDAAATQLSIQATGLDEKISNLTELRQHISEGTKEKEYRFLYFKQEAPQTPIIGDIPALDFFDRVKPATLQLL